MNKPASRPSTQRKRRVGLAFIALGCCSLLAFLYALPHLLLSSVWIRQRLDVANTSSLWAFERAEYGASNVLQQFGRKGELSQQIVFLGIDTPSFDQSDLSREERMEPTLQMMAGTVPGTPFPRAIYARVLERLVPAGAKTVIFDVLFLSEKPEDERFQEVLAKFRAHVVIGSNLQLLETESGTKRGFVSPPSSSLVPGEGQYDGRVGFVNFMPDPDGLVRRSHYRTTPQEYFGTAGAHGGRELLSLTAQGASQAGLGDAIPMGHGPRLFRYLAEAPAISLKDIFVPRLWERNFGNGTFFKDKLVFIGPFGNWSKDELQTPLGTKLGPVIHLSALNALCQGDFLAESGRWLDLALIFLGGLTALGVGFAVEGPLFRTALLLLASTLFVGVAFLLYNGTGLMLNLIGPNAALLSSGFIGLAWERVLEASEKTRIRSTLERYVSKDVVAEVLDNPDSFLLEEGGQRKPITVLFSDVRGFTTLTESADPRQLVLQLNEYFTAMVRIVFAHRGTLDKFIGDSVMAHWGSIVSRGESADACRAVAAALDMLRVVCTLNADWKARGLIELQIGLGVNHGEAICAHIGSDEKHEMTAIGDAVNLASRLEGATKEFHQDLLIGERVAPLVRECYHLRSVDLLQVKGKTQPVEVFAVVGKVDEPEPAWLPSFEAGVRHYRARDFAEAAACFASSLEQAPGDWLSTEYAGRCHSYQVSPPPAEWNGVFVMASK